MKNINRIKLILGLILLSFTVFSAVIFFLESFNVVESVLFFGFNATIWQLSDLTSFEFPAFSNMPIFLGLCGLSGAHLLNSIKS